jgi:hypothetical protein
MVPAPGLFSASQVSGQSTSVTHAGCGQLRGQVSDLHKHSRSTYINQVWAGSGASAPAMPAEVGDGSRSRLSRATQPAGRPRGQRLPIGFGVIFPDKQAPGMTRTDRKSKTVAETDRKSALLPLADSAPSLPLRNGIVAGLFRARFALGCGSCRCLRPRAVPWRGFALGCGSWGACAPRPGRAGRMGAGCSRRT